MMTNEKQQKCLDSMTEVLKNKIKEEFTGRIYIDMTQGMPAVMEVTRKIRFSVKD